MTNSGEKREKEVLLSELDPLWPTLRHMHIADTMNWIIDNFNTFIRENQQSTKLRSEKVESLKEMSAAIRGLPQFQEMLGKVIKSALVTYDSIHSTLTCPTRQWRSSSAAN